MWCGHWIKSQVDITKSSCGTEWADPHLVQSDHNLRQPVFEGWLLNLFES